MQASLSLRLLPLNFFKANLIAAPEVHSSISDRLPNLSILERTLAMRRQEQLPRVDTRCLPFLVRTSCTQVHRDTSSLFFTPPHGLILCERALLQMHRCICARTKNPHSCVLLAGGMDSWWGLGLILARALVICTHTRVSTRLMGFSLFYIRKLPIRPW